MCVYVSRVAWDAQLLKRKQENKLFEKKILGLLPSPICLFLCCTRPRAMPRVPARKPCAAAIAASMPKRRACSLSVLSLEKWPLAGDGEIDVHVTGLFDEGGIHAAWWPGVIRAYEARTGKYTIKYVDGEIEEYTADQITWCVKRGMLRFTALDPLVRRE
jgi:hypothetical protein